MRHQKEIEGIFRVLHEFDSRMKDKYDVLTILIGRETGKTMSLHHLATYLQAWMLCSN